MLKKLVYLNLFVFVLFNLVFLLTAYEVQAQGVINLPQTGQTKCYNTLGAEISCAGTGQDGELQIGVDWPYPRFTVSGDCVIDNLTGLMWAKNGNLPNGTKTWQGALDYVASINSGSGLCGYKDWRLPNINELESLVNSGESNIATWLNNQNQGFYNVQWYYWSYYWSSTTYATLYAWSVNMWDGSVRYDANSYNYFVWPVRSGQLNGTDLQYPANVCKTGQTYRYATGDDGDHERGVAWPAQRFTDNGDGTVTDNLTGLMWAKNANLPSGTRTWQGALDHVALINAGAGLYGFKDWRLPNRKELLSLIDRSRYNPALPANHPFQDVQSLNYWSSTKVAGSTGSAWAVYMWDGRVGSESLSYYVWPVRGIPNPLNDTTEFVKQQYRDFLNREAETEGLQHWVNVIDSGAMTRAQVIESFFWSEEFGATIAPVVRLYFAYFLRIPDYEGLMYWINVYKSGGSLGAISDSFAGSEEFQQMYGALSNESFVNLVYQNILGRAPDPGGYAFWVGELNSGRRTRGQVMIGFSESAEYKGLTSHEVYVTMMYVGMLRRGPEEEGFNFWVDYLDSGNSGLALIDGFLNSQEYANRFYVIPSAQEVGDAIYRYNSLFGISEAHAGLYYRYTGGDPKDPKNHKIIHIAGPGHTVIEETLHDFTAGETLTYYGAYTASLNGKLSFDIREKIISTGLQLRDANIPYVAVTEFFNTLIPDWSDDFWSGEVNDIARIRCDGVVEYCYEKNGIQVWAREAEAEKWNISKPVTLAEYKQSALWQHNDQNLPIEPNELTPNMQRGVQGTQYTNMRPSQADNPTKVSNLISTTHYENCKPKDLNYRRIAIEWEDATDEQSGIWGYYIRVDSNPISIPDYNDFAVQKVSLQPNFDSVFPDKADYKARWESIELNPGVYYVHIRSIDNAGNWCEDTPEDCTGHIGPLCIECANIAGNWSGTATYWGEDLSIFFYLSQNECNVSGTFQSPDSCPSQCGYPLNGNITGRVSGNIFTLTILNDPLVDCETCEFICAGTDKGSLTINGSRMYGTAKSEDCEVGTFDDVWVNLTRSSAVSSINKLEKKKGIGKSSLLSPKSYNKLLWYIYAQCEQGKE